MGPRETAAPATPPIFFLHGGPSFAGLEEELGELGVFEEKWLPFLDVSDLVVVSQRGIGPSKPTTTIDLTVGPDPLDEELDRSEAARRFEEVAGSGEEYWASRGLDL